MNTKNERFEKSPTPILPSECFWHDHESCWPWTLDLLMRKAIHNSSKEPGMAKVLPATPANNGTDVDTHKASGFVCAEHVDQNAASLAPINRDAFLVTAGG
jgi:hypothetical protein